VKPSDLSARRPLSISSHGIAQYLASTPVAQRKILEDYLFPDESTAKIIQRQPARDVANSYFLSQGDPVVLHFAKDKYSAKPIKETPHARARREAALDAIDGLPRTWAALDLTDTESARYSIPIAGLTVRASIDLLATHNSSGNRIAVIFNTAKSISQNEALLKHYGKVQCEIALRAGIVNRLNLDAAWYVDICSGQRIRAQASPVERNWRNIEIVCDNIAIEMRELLRRRARRNAASGNS
jgi:hypothetical protein